MKHDPDVDIEVVIEQWRQSSQLSEITGTPPTALFSGQ
jgi:hypothetical protein